MSLKKYKIERYLSEIDNQLMEIIKNNKRVLIICPMNTGKTQYLLDNVKKWADNEGNKVLAIEPVKILIEQLEKRVDDKWGLYYGDRKDDIAFKQGIITTVDNSLNVSEAWNNTRKPFVASLDESHEEEFSQGYRAKFANIDKLLQLEYCKNVLYFTATGEDLKEHFADKFDAIVEVSQHDFIVNETGAKVPNPYKKPFASKTILNYGSWNAQTIAELWAQKRAEGNQLITIKVDSLEKMRDIKSIIEKRAKMLGIHEEVNIVSSKKIKYLSDEVNQEQRDKESAFREKLRNKEYLGANNTVITTCVMQSGIELNNDPNAILLNVIKGDDYIETNMIQLVGRFRNKIKEHQLLINVPKDQEEPRPLKEVKDIYKGEKFTAENYIQFLTTMMKKDPLAQDKHIKTATNITGVDHVERFNTVEFMLNDVVLKAEAIAKHQRQYLHPLYDKELKKGLQERYGHILGDIVIKHTDTKLLADKHSRGIKNELKQDKVARCEKVDQLKEEIKEGIPSDIEELELILEDEAFGFLSEEQKDLKRKISEVRQLEPSTRKLEKEFATYVVNAHYFWYFFTSMSKKDFKEALEAGRKMYLNRAYYHDDETRQGFKTLAYKERHKNIKPLRQYKTLEYFDNQNLKNGDWITKTHYKDLINMYANLGIKIYTNYFEMLKEGADKKELEKTLNKLMLDINKYLGQLFSMTVSTKDTSKGKRDYLRYSSERIDSIFDKLK